MDIICERCKRKLIETDAVGTPDGKVTVAIRPCGYCLSFTDGMSEDEGRLREQKRIGRRTSGGCFGQFNGCDIDYIANCNFHEACRESADGNLPDTIQETRERI